MPEDLLTPLLALMPDAALAVDREGRVVAANAPAHVLFGYDAGGLVGLPVDDLVPGQLRERHRRHRGSYLGHPQRRPMGQNLDLAGRRRDGSEMPVDISLAPVDASGELLVLAAIRDLSDRHAASAAQAELASIIRSSLDAIVSMNLEGEITTWNEGAEDLFGYTADEMLGRHLTVLVPPESLADLDHLLRLAHEDVSRGAVDTRWLSRTGSEIDVAVSISPIYGPEERLDGYSAFARDVRDRKAAEDELRRALEEEERLERQHAAMAEIRLALLSGSSLSDALSLVCERASAILEATAAAITVREGDELQVAAGVGPLEVLVGTRLPSGGLFVDRVVESGSHQQAERLKEATSTVLEGVAADGPALGVPVLVGGVVRAALVLVRADKGEAFGQSEVVAAESLAAQAALAFELERARGDRERMMLANDRERIARDLHDHVIQELFATGMALQSTIPFAESEQLRERISAAIDGLDDTIREIRNTIYGLSASQTTDRQLRNKLLELVASAEDQLGFAPSVRFEGPIDAGVPSDIAVHVVAVVREALSNTARHAHADQVQVQVALDDGSVRVSVSDDGVGIGHPERSSGLTNLDERARLLGGRFVVSQAAGGGTRLDWSAPVGRP
ncbi:MAG TPA: PAS domain S-box protein [Acidimicrobiales bacterium]|nr:PAS domain S-box protein [Acidimicrobiales bacterium]